MSDDKPDTTTMSGAEFQRHAGTDAQKWAEAFLAAYVEAWPRACEPTGAMAESIRPQLVPRLRRGARGRGGGARHRPPGAAA